MFFLEIGTKLVKISSGEKCFRCGSHLDKRPKELFCKTLLLGRWVLLNINIKIFKTVILAVVLCGCENWSVTLSEKHRMSVSENRVLRGIFGFKRQ